MRDNIPPLTKNDTDQLIATVRLVADKYKQKADSETDERKSFMHTTISVALNTCADLAEIGADEILRDQKEPEEWALDISGEIAAYALMHQLSSFERLELIERIRKLSEGV